MYIDIKKESHYILTKGPTHQEDTTDISTFTPKLRAPNFIKQILMDRKGQRHPHIIAAGDFSKLISFLDRSSKQRSAKKTHS